MKRLIDRQAGDLIKAIGAAAIWRQKAGEFEVFNELLLEENRELREELNRMKANEYGRIGNIKTGAD